MSFEKLRVYQAAERLDAEVRRLILGLALLYRDDINQLERAVASILYNIAEANGSLTNGRKRYHLQVARGSTDEARAILRRLAARGAFPPSAILKSCSLTSAIAKMLTAMYHALPAR